MSLSVAVACAADERIAPAKGSDPQNQPTPLEAPELRLLAPSVWAAGERITVLGSRFVAPERGHTILNVSGTFSNAGGQEFAVAMSVVAEYVNAGQVEFTFEADAPPNGFGHVLGTFTGKVRAANADDHETTQLSNPIDATIEVAPSLILWSVRPSGVECGTARVDRTQDGKKVVIEVESLGLTAPTSYMPLTFTTSYVDFSGETQVETVTKTSSRRAELTVNFGSVPYGAVGSRGLVNLEVEDGMGEVLTRTYSIDFQRRYTVAYDGNVRIAELYAPVQVSGCIPGGAFGQNVSYTGGQSESRSRSIGFSANIGIDIWVVNIGFGINVTDSVSTSESESLSMSGEILPNQFGVFYRQTQRLERHGQIIERTACGAENVIGTAMVTDWDWAPDLAVTRNGSCPPPPPTNLPPAQVLE